jgi:nucleoside-diphosphate-sugar epimerase
MAKLVCGCGYLGKRVALLWKQAGHEVFAVTRSSRRADELMQVGIRPVVGDLTDGIVLPEPASLDTVLFAVGYDQSADRTIHEVYVHGLRSALNALPDSLQRFIYISSTGVYGQTAGELVDEESPCDPSRAGGIACLAAERLLSQHRLSSRGIVLRLAGLYGPGRIPKLDSLRAGASLAVSSSGYLNLIHIDDAARVVLAAEARAPLPSCYVVSDGCPAKRRDFYHEAARLLGSPPPRFEEPAAGTSAYARATSSKRLVTTRLQRDLAVTLQYPTYREGLAAIVGSR